MCVIDLADWKVHTLHIQIVFITSTTRLSYSHKNLHYLPDAWVLTEDCYPLGTRPKFRSFTHIKIWITWCVNANSRLLSFQLLGTQPKFWSFSCCLVIHPFKILMLGSDFLEYFHQTYKLSVHFFREPCHLQLCLSLEVAKFFFVAVVLNYFLCVFHSFCIFRKISEPLNDKRVFKYFKFQRKEALSNQNQKYSSTVCCVNAWPLAGSIHNKCYSPRLLLS